MASNRTTYYFAVEAKEVSLSASELAKELDQQFSWFEYEASVQEAEASAYNQQWV